MKKQKLEEMVLAGILSSEDLFNENYSFSVEKDSWFPRWKELDKQEVEKYNAKRKAEIDRLPNFNALDSSQTRKGQEFLWNNNLATVTNTKSDGTINAVWHSWRGDRILTILPGTEDANAVKQGSLKPNTKITPNGNYTTPDTWPSNLK